MDAGLAGPFYLLDERDNNKNGSTDNVSDTQTDTMLFKI